MDLDRVIIETLNGGGSLKLKLDYTKADKIYWIPQKETLIQISRSPTRFKWECERIFQHPPQSINKINFPKTHQLLIT